MRRVYLLSPAHTGGKRAQMLMRDGADFDLATRLRSANGAPLGEIFAFMSGLYFRGKLAYANAFARPPAGVAKALVIVPGRGLTPSDTNVKRADLLAMAAVGVEPDDPRYRAPLLRDARRLAKQLGARDQVVLLGSIATGKYADLLLSVFGESLCFPSEFVGRGDMSRGGLLLRCVAAGTPLDYVALATAERHGPRPPRLQPRPRS